MRPSFKVNSNNFSGHSNGLRLKKNINEIQKGNGRRSRWKSEEGNSFNSFELEKYRPTLFHEYSERSKIIFFGLWCKFANIVLVNLADKEWKHHIHVPPYFFVHTLTTDPQNDLLCYHHIMLAENFTADETDSVRVKPRENDEVCHFLRSVQALWVKCDVYCIML